jgi:hypothetical protein
VVAVVVSDNFDLYFCAGSDADNIELREGRDPLFFHWEEFPVADLRNLS